MLEHQGRLAAFGGPRHAPRADRRGLAAAVLPFLRGCMATLRPPIGIFDDSAEALEFVNAHGAEALAEVGTSAPTTSCAPASSRSMSSWDPASGTLDTLQGGHHERRRAVPHGLHGVLPRRSQRRRRRACATRTPRWCSCLASGCSRSARTRRRRATPPNFTATRSASWPAPRALGGGRTAPGPLSQPKSAEQAAGFTPSTTTSRSLAARRSTSSTGRSRKQSCSACRRQGVQPPDLPDRRRRQRDRPGGRRCRPPRWARTS